MEQEQENGLSGNSKVSGVFNNSDVSEKAKKDVSIDPFFMTPDEMMEKYGSPNLALKPFRKRVDEFIDRHNICYAAQALSLEGHYFHKKEAKLPPPQRQALMMALKAYSKDVFSSGTLEGLVSQRDSLGWHWEGPAVFKGNSRFPVVADEAKEKLGQALVAAGYITDKQWEAYSASSPKKDKEDLAPDIP